MLLNDLPDRKPQFRRWLAICGWIAGGDGVDTQKNLILVTGSSGLIGSTIVERLAGAFEVAGLDVSPPRRLPPGASHFNVDLTSDQSLRDAMEQIRGRHGGKIASVIHLAAYYDFSGEPSPLYEQVTVRGTERLLVALHEFAVEQFIFSSTMLIHAPCQLGHRINEDSPIEAKWDYPQSKVQTEQVIHQKHGQIPAVLLRIAGVYTDRCNSIPLAHQIQRIYERQLTSHVFPGDISHGQSFVHLDDLADAFVNTIDRRHELPPYLPLLIGEPQTLSYDELQRAFGQLIHGEQWTTHQIPKSMAKAGAWVQDHLPLIEEPFIKPWMIDLADDHYALDITRAAGSIGWQPRHSLRDTLPRMIEALKADPQGWYRKNKLNPTASEEKENTE